MGDHVSRSKLPFDINLFEGRDAFEGGSENPPISIYDETLTELV
jgi:hypothetical protein